MSLNKKTDRVSDDSDTLMNARCLVSTDVPVVCCVTTTVCATTDGIVDGKDESYNSLEYHIPYFAILSQRVRPRV